MSTTESPRGSATAPSPVQASVVVPPHAPPPARWQVRLLGAVVAEDGATRIERFPSRAVAVLLARVALAPERAHPREELVELLWPGVQLDVGRNRLRQALSTLKSLLEPPGVAGAAVVVADRLAVRAAPGALACDARSFEALARAGHAAAAQALYQGELMPGHYDDWVLAERERLASLHEALDHRLASTTPKPAPMLSQAPATAPAPAPAPAVALPPFPTQLPSYLTRLIGAELAAARLLALLRQNRLVTLLGPGGSGKTRLAVEVATALSGAQDTDWPGASSVRFERVAFVPLVACESRTQMHDAVRRALGLIGGNKGMANEPGTAGAAGPAGNDGAAAGTHELAAALAGQAVLLVLDNFEQLPEDAAAAVGELLARLPLLHVLATSRRVLGLDGECCVSAEPLALPAEDAPLASAAASPAVALFVDRARAARSDFHLGPRNHAGVVALVRALGGMPLAIELAASRVRSLSPADMVAMIESQGHQLALLARSGPRAGHDRRHASMAEVIGWSWRLLGAAERATLSALAAFPASACAEAVAAAEAEADPAATTLRFDALVAQSMAHSAAGDAGPTRFGMVEPVREFVLGQTSAAELDRLRQRQRDWLLAWARPTHNRLSPAQVSAELPLVHAVLGDPRAQGAAENDAAALHAAHMALELAVALRGFWDSQGLPVPMQAQLETTLDAFAHRLPQALRADAHETLAYLRFAAGFSAKARAHADAALALAGEQPAQRSRALTRSVWVALAAGRSGRIGGMADDAALQAQLEEALALARAVCDREAEARALHQQAVMDSYLMRDWPRAEARLAESRQLWLALGDRPKAYARLRNLAQGWAATGRIEDALASLHECERAAAADADWVGSIDSQLSLAMLLAGQRRWVEALASSRSVLALCWQRWHRHGLAYALWSPPLLLARLRKPEPALRLMGFAAAHWRSQFGPLNAADARTAARVRRLATAILRRDDRAYAQARADMLWREGSAMPLAQALQLALTA